MKILRVTPTHVTFDHEFWDGYNQRRYNLTSTFDRKYPTNTMSLEFAIRHGLKKYFI